MRSLILRRAALTATTARRACYSTKPSSVDDSEIKKFSAMAEDWWNPDGEFAMLQLMNPPRVSYVREQLGKTKAEPKPFQGLRMLDIGCGGGLLSEALVRLGGNVLGADAAYDNIQMAKVHAKQDPRLSEHLEYRNTTAEDLHAEGETFDVVCAMEIIEHVSRPDEFLKTCASMVRPGGHLFLSTMSRTFIAHFLTVFLAEDLLRLVHRGTHDWHKYIKSQELAEAVRGLGQDWTVQDMRGIYWDPLRRKWWLSQQKGLTAPCGLENLEVNYLLAAQRLQ